MNEKELKHLFMKIDADSNGSVGKCVYRCVVGLKHCLWCRVARVHELHVAGEPDVILDEEASLGLRQD